MRVLYLSSLDSAYTVKIPISSFSFFKCFILSDFIAPTRIPAHHNATHNELNIKNKAKLGLFY
jgi:hypothetical protein